MMFKQTTNVMPIKYVTGYGVSNEFEVKKHDHFCEF